ncbi:MAG: ASCH domain-containing protein [Candidatus Micrarchaeaceae archaeon]
MKCLSLMQPYAELVVSGRKRIELRRWNTRFRGKFYIHASKKLDAKACKRVGIDPKSLAYGCIIGTAVIHGVKVYESRKEFMGDSQLHLANYGEYGSSKYGFILIDASRAKIPIAFKGRLGLFEAGMV